MKPAHAGIIPAELRAPISGWPVEIGVSVHFLSFFLKPVDGKLIVEGI